MTLVVAKKEKNSDTGSELVFIVSDTILIAHYTYGGLPLHWKNSVIKTSILDANLAVSWAGKCDVADTCLMKFNSREMMESPKEEIINFFYESHLNALDTDEDNQEVDFILSFKPSNTIFAFVLLSHFRGFIDFSFFRFII